MANSVRKNYQMIQLEVMRYCLITNDSVVKSILCLVDVILLLSSDKPYNYHLTSDHCVTHSYSHTRQFFTFTIKIRNIAINIT